MHQDQEGISFVFVLNVSVTAIKPDPLLSSVLAVCMGMYNVH